MDVGKSVNANRPVGGGDTYQIENSNPLDIAVDGTVMTKAGSMVAYDGDLKSTSTAARASRSTATTYSPSSPGSSTRYRPSTVSATGGLTNVFLEGPGHVAITTHGTPLVLTPPVKTDPAATVAWSGATSPSSSVNRSLSDMVGQSSGERYQLEFSDADGFVVVQPYEEGTPQQ